MEIGTLASTAVFKTLCFIWRFFGYAQHRSARIDNCCLSPRERRTRRPNINERKVRMSQNETVLAPRDSSVFAGYFRYRGRGRC